MNERVDERLIHGRSAAEIADSIREAIRSKRVAPGAPLPTIRALSANLGVNRNTVAAAYAALADAGMVSSQGRNGTIIAPILQANPPPELIPPGVCNLSEGNPDPALLPDVSVAISTISAEPRLYGDALVLPELNETGRRWFGADGLDDGMLAVTGGALDAFERILATSLMPGDAVAVESPCFHRTLYLLRSLGLTPIPVPVDEEGLDPSALEQVLRQRVRALIVTPQAHNPTGASITETRARELRQVLRQAPEILVIQDDYFSLVVQQPPNWIAGPERTRWAAVRSLAKCFGPDLRVCLVLGDASTIGALERRMRLGQRWVSYVLQGIAFHLLEDIETRGLMRKARNIYARRRGRLIDALKKCGLDSVTGGGLNVWAKLPYDQQLAQALLLRGWAVKSSSPFSVHGNDSAIRISVGLLPEDSIPNFVNELRSSAGMDT